MQGEDLNAFVAEISSFGPEPPLAFNTRLIEAARDHSQAMIQADNQFHAPADYLTNPASGHAYDGQAYYPTGNNWWATGENIFAYSSGVSGGVTAFVNYLEAGFELDWGNPDHGHLTNLLAPGPGEWSPSSGGHYRYSEIGIGLIEGVTGKGVGPDVVTQEFGWRSGNPILTGCFYTDQAGTGLYAPGEGLGGVTIRAVGRNGQGVFTTQTWASGGYSLVLPPGTYDVTATGGLPYALSTTVTLGKDNVEWEWGFKPMQSDQPVPGNYLGNGQAGFAVFRPATDQWFIDGQAQPVAFGGLGLDLPAPADYDGVGHTEVAVYRPTTAQWFVIGPSGGRLLTTFGWARHDIPVPGDYDGVGHAEVAVYRPTTAQWFVLNPNGTQRMVWFGQKNVDIPVPGDYDGVGHAEVAVYRPTTGEWFVVGPGGGRRIATFGQPGVDIPVPGDYDGVGHLEPAVYRPTTGQWFILGPNGVRIVTLGQPGLDVPIRADYDGDHRTDPAVYRPSTAEWFVLKSSTSTVRYRAFGQGGSSSPVSNWLANYASHPSPQVTQSVVSAPLAGWGVPGALAVGGPPRARPRQAGPAGVRWARF
jgi:hypothetical protein